MKVVFRADGSAHIGLGHLVRCLALAQMLKENFEITFIYKEITAEIAQEVKDSFFQAIKIKTEENFLDLLTGNEIVVIDHYGINSAGQKAVKQKGCKLVCIDDLHDKPFHADLIINHAPNVLPSSYQAQQYTKFALGLDYVLLRPIFLQYVKQQHTCFNKTTVLVCFGGSDNRNITADVTEILKSDKRFKKIIIVVGSGYHQLNELKKLINDDDRIHLHHAISADIIARLILEAGLCIVPASGILQEVIALGSTTISGMYVGNQRNIFDNFKKLNAFINAEDFNKAAIVKAIDLSFASDIKLRTRIIDGNSDQRLLKLFKNLT